MDASLQEFLRTLMTSGTEDNPALEALLRDYTTYHLVLAVVGVVFLLVVIVMGVFFWRRFRRAPQAGTRKWTFEKKAYLSFGVLSLFVGLFLALVVTANVSTVLNPRQGFTGSISMLKNPQPGTPTDDVYRSVSTWLQSGSAQTPPILQKSVDDRLAWQRPKAIVSTVLLVGFVVISALVWRALIRKSREPDARWTSAGIALLLLGAVSVFVCLLLMLMVMGNTQGSLAPISLTLFFA